MREASCCPSPKKTQTDIIEAFDSVARYLDDLFNIDNIYIKQMLNWIYSTELYFNKANQKRPFLF